MSFRLMSCPRCWRSVVEADLDQQLLLRCLGLLEGLARAPLDRLDLVELVEDELARLLHRRERR
jgi:hypothetical protein